MKKINYSFGILLAFMLLACNFNDIYEKVVDIPKSEWDKKKAASFQVPVTDTLTSHDIYLNVRNNNDYLYSNLFVFVTLIAPNGKSVKDTIEITLADEKGKWLGHGFSGVWSTKQVYKRQVRFSQPGIYKINIQQGMRDDILRGIPDIGINIEKSKL